MGGTGASMPEGHPGAAQPDDCDVPLVMLALYHCWVDSTMCADDHISACRGLAGDAATHPGSSQLNPFPSLTHGASIHDAVDALLVLVDITCSSRPSSSRLVVETVPWTPREPSRLWVQEEAWLRSWVWVTVWLQEQQQSHAHDHHQQQQQQQEEGRQATAASTRAAAAARGLTLEQQQAGRRRPLRGAATSCGRSSWCLRGTAPWSTCTMRGSCWSSAASSAGGGCGPGHVSPWFQW